MSSQADVDPTSTEGKVGKRADQVAEAWLVGLRQRASEILRPEVALRRSEGASDDTIRVEVSDCIVEAVNTSRLDKGERRGFAAVLFISLMDLLKEPHATDQ